MKKILYAILLLLLLSATNVKAEIPEKFNKSGIYTNKNGVQISKENYNKIKEFVNETKLENIDKKIYKEIEESDRIVAFESAVIETIYTTIGNKKIILENNYISEEEYEKRAIASRSYNDVVDTEYKHIHLMATDKGGTYTFYIQNNWLKTPKYKSFDVIALRWEGSVVEHRDTAVGSQDYMQFKGQVNPPTIDYNSSSSNFKFSNIGVGLSQNLVDDASYYTNVLRINTTCSGNVILYGTYQHSQADISLADSQSYTFSEAGLGDILYFRNTSIGNVYDKTPGLKVSFVC